MVLRYVVAERENILNDRSFYAFSNIHLDKIPKEALQKFMDIYDEFSKNYEESEPTMQSLVYALQLIVNGEEKITDKYEKMAFQVANRMMFYKYLLRDALREYNYSNLQRWYDKFEYGNKVKFETPYLLQQAILIDHILRHKEKIPTLRKISRLRCSTRKKLGLDKKESVGF